ncbi:beta-phosphoglucomutase family hydrolase [Thermoleophilia bacterium SCSIO 60948]|nr:beta-phosphoglucomutase family hydrolase [Thermoleophilia bacterium SCSIO 60948]
MERPAGELRVGADEALDLERRALREPLDRVKHAEVVRDRVETAAVDQTSAACERAVVVLDVHPVDELGLPRQVEVVGAGLGACAHERLAVVHVGPDRRRDHPRGACELGERGGVGDVGAHRPHLDPLGRQGAEPLADALELVRVAARDRPFRALRGVGGEVLGGQSAGEAGRAEEDDVEGSGCVGHGFWECIRVLGLPDDITTLLFDLDGVLTRTADVHAAAWKQTFDELLRARAERDGSEFREFEPTDYTRHVDGKPREAGVRDFLASREIELPEGEDSDPPEAESVHGVARRKNDLVGELIERDGVEVFSGSIDYLRAARDAGLRTAVVSSSRNTPVILDAAGIADLFETRVDGSVAAERGLPGKPAPDTFLEAARELGAEPGHAAVFEDALAGVEAGRAGDFGYVVGVDRAGHAEALREHGADVVVADLEELL